jgi:hypothetical protein
MSATEIWKQRVAAHHAQLHKATAALGETVMDVWESAHPPLRPTHTALMMWKLPACCGRYILLQPC